VRPWQYPQQSRARLTIVLRWTCLVRKNIFKTRSYRIKDATCGRRLTCRSARTLAASSARLLVLCSQPGGPSELRKASQRPQLSQFFRDLSHDEAYSNLSLKLSAGCPAGPRG
jgi:hypothetical protein